MNERVKQIRKSLNLTLKEFGEKLGVQSAAINKIEKGTVSLTDQMFKLICREYNVNETWLRTGVGRMFIDLEEEAELTQWVSDNLTRTDSDFKRRFIKMLTKFTDQQWADFESYVHQLSAEMDITDKGDTQNATQQDTDTKDTDSKELESKAIESAESEYIKRLSSSAPKTASSASNTTKETAVGE